MGATDTFRPQSGLGATEVHEVLRNERRKRTLELLTRERRHVELHSLAEWIAEVETGESPPPKDREQSVYNSLHQTHLPKLERLGVVEYDRDQKTVTLGPDARTVERYMSVRTPYGITWSTYYRTLAVVGFGAVVAAELGVVLGPAHTQLVASLFLFAVAVSAAYQLWASGWLAPGRLSGG